VQSPEPGVKGFARKPIFFALSAPHHIHCKRVFQILSGDRNSMAPFPAEWNFTSPYRLCDAVNASCPIESSQCLGTGSPVFIDHL